MDATPIAALPAAFARFLALLAAYDVATFPSSVWVERRVPGTTKTGCSFRVDGRFVHDALGFRIGDRTFVAYASGSGALRLRESFRNTPGKYPAVLYRSRTIADIRALLAAE